MPIIFSYILLLGSALLLAGIGVLISFLGEKACLSKQCIGQAKFIYRSMNKRLDPCDDFYSFVCTKFPKYGNTIFDDIELNSLRLLISFLEVPADWETDNRVEHISKTLFQHCVNETQLESEGLRPLERVLKKFGSVPFLDPQWDHERKEEFTVVKFEMAHFYNGLNSVFVYNRVIKMKSYPSIHPKNESHEEVKEKMYHAYAIPPHLYHAVAPDVESYYKYCVEISDVYSKALGTNKTITDKDKHEIKQAAIFKSKLLKIIDRSKNCSAQPFVFVKKRILLKRFANFAGVEKEDETTLIDYAVRKGLPGVLTGSYFPVTPNFLKYTEEVDKLIYATPVHVLANYMAVEAIIQMTPFLPLKFRELYDKYLKPEKDKTNKVLNVRQFHCAKLVKDAMTVAITTEYLTKNPKPMKEMSMFNPIMYKVVEAVKLILKHIKWASSRDRQKMLRLMNTMKIVSPLPPEVIELLKLGPDFENFYIIMCMNEDSTLESYLSVKAVRMIRNAGILNEVPFPYSIFHEDYDIFDVDIYYHQENNSIVVPMAYMLYPSLDGLWPKYLSYGGLAVWLAHTIIKTIGYDNVLYYPDRDPNTEEEITLDWWDKETISRYENKRRCAFYEYNHYLKPFRVKSNDANCLEDTLYYAAAVQAAYNAYKEDTRMRFFVEPRIPYLTKYNVDQIFFIKFASSFCQYEGTEFKLYRNNSDTTIVSSNFTVLYSLKNFPKFREVFKCEASDKMTKKKTCDILI